MLLAVESGIFAADVPQRERLLRIKSAGFDAVDFSYFQMRIDEPEYPGAFILGDDYRERARELRAYAEEIGITVNQAHAPFQMLEGDAFSAENPKYLRLVRSIESAAILGAPSIVVHAVKTERADFFEYNREFYLSLLPVAERCGIKIAVENLFGARTDDGKLIGILDDPSVHMDFVRSLGSPYFSICLDIGHSAVTGHAPEDVIRAMDPALLRHLHVHDNDCCSDLHRTPFSCRLDWRAICSALGEIGYRGDMSLELIGQFRAYTDESLFDSALAYAASVGRELIRLTGK